MKILGALVYGALILLVLLALFIAVFQLGRQVERSGNTQTLATNLS
jgi:flagellar biosynthesis/type III secretory pathway M-ring protein FliF/YscJ